MSRRVGGRLLPPTLRREYEESGVPAEVYNEHFAAAGYKRRRAPQAQAKPYGKRPAGAIGEASLAMDMGGVIARVNATGGPQVLPDPGRGGYGLFADRDYKKIDSVVTRFGGVTLRGGHAEGDYVAKLGGGFWIDGSKDFLPEEKGRWINERDGRGSDPNVTLGREVRLLKPVAKGEQFFSNYGDEYERNY